MRTRFLHALTRLPLLALLLGQPAFGLEPRDQQALDLMNFAVKQTVKETGVEVIGVGSWTSGKNYKGPLTGRTSDHDMRVVLTGETSQAAQARKWKDFQEKLKENIVASGQAKRLSEADIGKLLKSTNVYPPSQVMETVESAQDARKLFDRIGTQPNLGGEPVEGLWGKGSKTYTHYYEEKSGKLFFMDPKYPDRVMTGGTDLTHLVEGVEAYTTAGEVNKAGQWAEKVLEQLGEGNVDKAAKQAERLRTSINKARSLERLGGRVDYLDDIVSGKVTDPQAIRAAVARARQEAGLLLSLANESNVRTRHVMRSVLASEGGTLSRSGKLFWKYADKVPVGQLFRAWQLYGYYASAKDISAMTGPDFNAAVLNAYAKELGWLAGPLAGLGMELADATLQAARQGAYGVVTAFQDCENLATGIHSVKGREALNKGMSIDQMASLFPDTADGRSRLNNFVWSQAHQASLRFENNVWVEDATIRNSLYQKCHATLVTMWQEKRLAQISAFNQLFLEFDKLAARDKAVITIQPYGDPVPLREPTQQGKVATVTINAVTTQDPGKMQDLLKKMNTILAALEGGKKGDVIFASAVYEFSVDGRPQPRQYAPVHHTAIFRTAGEHLARLAVETSVVATLLSDDITQHAILQGYRKKYPSTATLPFSVVDDTARVALRIDAPRTVKVGQSFQLIGVIEQSQVERLPVQIAWGNIGNGQRLLNGYAPAVNRAERTPGSYQYLAEAFMVEQGRLVKLAEARTVVEVVAEEKKPDVADFLSALQTMSDDLKKQIPAKPSTPAPTPQPSTPGKKPDPKPAAPQANIAEKQALCECLNRYLTGERTQEQRRSYDKWCTNKERCKGTEIYLVEPFKYVPGGDYCWGYEECREHSFDPETKQSSTRTCGSFQGAYYMNQAKEMCARQK
ncbi:hypothetical protein [Rhodoferax sp.]|uniref:hypothetical protein n=1 Tax=Rhodoferax sp. TaxID=50421 RepID=UPI002634A45D|nr:hypothetical protein [Rhodoferax sp.]MDD2923786.1 hypothetical protein [Rhodoferax sp.]